MSRAWTWTPISRQVQALKEEGTERCLVSGGIHPSAIGFEAHISYYFTSFEPHDSAQRGIKPQTHDCKPHHGICRVLHTGFLPQLLTIMAMGVGGRHEVWGGAEEADAEHE